ncbi:MAG: hypothetical protein QGF33_00475 [Alphaproteobacteria bacterium]|nr:hypothetical protein [Alphaproteobacteria bacterium]
MATVNKRTNRLLAGLGVLSISSFLVPAVMFMAAGMAPTFVAAAIDRRAERFRTLCVGGLNFLGVLPFTVQLVSDGHTFEMAFSLLGNTWIWLAILSSAAVGWAIFAVVPTVVALLYVQHLQRRITRLQQRQGRLTDQWGPEVMGADAPPGDG